MKHPSDMITYNQVPKSGDPSNRIQSFEFLKMNVLCCRYWWLDRWKSYKMTFPFWRLYWNKTDGAYVQNHEKVYLTPEHLVLIPPETPFSTGIDGSSAGDQYGVYNLAGNWVRSRREEYECIAGGKVLHLFIHFNLGSQLDQVKPGIYRFDITPEQKILIERLTDSLLTEGTTFDIHASLDIYQLIISAVNEMPDTVFETNKKDFRVLFLRDYIEENMALNLQNKHLSEKVNMATNAFTRFFREQMKCSPQEYIRQVRIARACDLLCHSTLTIDEISETCGFSDRFHFSRVFKKLQGISPAEYRRKYILNEGVLVHL